MAFNVLVNYLDETNYNNLGTQTVTGDQNDEVQLKAPDGYHISDPNQYSIVLDQATPVVDVNCAAGEYVTLTVNYVNNGNNVGTQTIINFPDSTQNLKPPAGYGVPDGQPLTTVLPKEDATINVDVNTVTLYTNVVKFVNTNNVLKKNLKSDDSIPLQADPPTDAPTTGTLYVSGGITANSTNNQQTVLKLTDINPLFADLLKPAVGEDGWDDASERYSLTGDGRLVTNSLIRNEDFDFDMRIDGITPIATDKDYSSLNQWTHVNTLSNPNMSIDDDLYVCFVPDGQLMPALPIPVYAEPSTGFDDENPDAEIHLTFQYLGNTIGNFDAKVNLTLRGDSIDVESPDGYVFSDGTEIYTIDNLEEDDVITETVQVAPDEKDGNDGMTAIVSGAANSQVKVACPGGFKTVDTGDGTTLVSMDKDGDTKTVNVSPTSVTIDVDLVDEEDHVIATQILAGMWREETFINAPDGWHFDNNDKSHPVVLLSENAGTTVTIRPDVARDEFEFDGYNSKDMGLIVKHVNKDVAPAMASQTQDVPSMYGTLNRGNNYTQRDFTIHCTIMAEDDDDNYNTIIQNLAKYLIRQGTDEYSMVFGDNPNVEYFGQFTEIPTPEQLMDDVIDSGFDLKFTAFDPKGYLPQQTFLFTELNQTFTPDGTGICYPIYDILLKEDIDELGMTFDSNNSYIDIGTRDPSQIDPAYDIDPYLVNDPCTTLASWNCLGFGSYAPIGTLGGDIDGSLTSVQNSITVNRNITAHGLDHKGKPLYDYGEQPHPGRWFGPCAVHENLDDPVRNFQCNFRLHHIKTYSRSMSSSNFFLVDSNNKEIMHAEISDQSHGAASFCAIWVDKQLVYWDKMLGMHDEKNKKKHLSYDVPIKAKPKKKKKKKKHKVRSVYRAIPLNDVDAENMAKLDKEPEQFGVQLLGAKKKTRKKEKKRKDTHKKKKKKKKGTKKKTVPKFKKKNIYLEDYNNRSYFNDAFIQFELKKVHKEAWLSLRKCHADGRPYQGYIAQNIHINLGTDYAMETAIFYARKYNITEDRDMGKGKRLYNYNYGFNSVTNYSVQALNDDQINNADAPTIIAHAGDEVIVDTEAKKVYKVTGGGIKSLEQYVSWGTQFAGLQGGTPTTIGVDPQLGDKAESISLQYRPTLE